MTYDEQREKEKTDIETNDTDSDYDLHIQAGLTCTGENDEGEIEFVGTGKQWDEYEKLSN